MMFPGMPSLPMMPSLSPYHNMRPPMPYMVSMANKPEYQLLVTNLCSVIEKKTKNACLAVILQDVWFVNSQLKYNTKFIVILHIKL